MGGDGDLNEGGGKGSSVSSMFHTGEKVRLAELADVLNMKNEVKTGINNNDLQDFEHECQCRFQNLRTE